MEMTVANIKPKVYVVMMTNHDVASSTDEVAEIFAKESVAQAYAEKSNKEVDDPELEYWVKEYVVNDSLKGL